MYCYSHLCIVHVIVDLFLSLHLYRGPVDFLSEGGDSENEEQKRREKREKEGSAKDKVKIPKRKERFMLLTSFVLSVQDDAV